MDDNTNSLASLPNNNLNSPKRNNVQNTSLGDEFTKDNEVSDYGVTIFTISGCTHCVQVKNILDETSISYRAVDLGSSAQKRKDMFFLCKSKSVPQVFCGNYYIGDASKIKSLHNANMLKKTFETNYSAFLASGKGLSSQLENNSEDFVADLDTLFTGEQNHNNPGKKCDFSVKNILSTASLLSSGDNFDFKIGPTEEGYCVCILEKSYRCSDILSTLHNQIEMRSYRIGMHYYENVFVGAQVNFQIQYFHESHHRLYQFHFILMHL